MEAEPGSRAWTQPLLEAADYSPEIAVATDASSPPRFSAACDLFTDYRQLKALHERSPDPKSDFPSGGHPAAV